MSKNKLIFIVDDDPFINRIVIKKFTNEGYRLEAFESGEDCLKAISLNPDLIILDYFFTNSAEKKAMNGMEIFDVIKQQKPGIPVIMLSGQDKGEVVLELARKGVDDYIIKDNNLVDNLSTAINDIFNRN
ncbi:MAG TPA: response regulator [Bacteroidales bacterium]|nr:response regulator [Bacteroidales bacterium]